MGSACAIAIRPEKLTVSVKGSAGIAATLRVHAFRGSYHVYEFDVPGRETPVIAYRQAALEGVEPGQMVSLGSDSPATLLID